MPQTNPQLWVQHWVRRLMKAVDEGDIVAAGVLTEVDSVYAALLRRRVSKHKASDLEAVSKRVRAAIFAGEWEAARPILLEIAPAWDGSSWSDDGTDHLVG